MNAGARLWQVIQPGEKLLFQQPDRYCIERMFLLCFRYRLHAQVPQRHNNLLLHYLFCLTRANCIFNLTMKGLWPWLRTIVNDWCEQTQEESWRTKRSNLLRLPRPPMLYSGLKLPAMTILLCRSLYLISGSSLCSRRGASRL